MDWQDRFTNMFFPVLLGMGYGIFTLCAVIAFPLWFPLWLFIHIKRGMNLSDYFQTSGRDV